MGMVPEPPRPPVAPPPPRSSSHVVSIALLVLALIILVSAMSVWVGFRILSRNVQVHVAESKDGKKEVSINTPVGSIEVNKNVNEASLGLPVYPGAKRLEDEGSASVNLNFPGEANVRVRVAKYETADPLDKVREFYKQRLGSEVTNYKEKSPEGKTVFEIKGGGQEKIVALKDRWSGTQIELVRVTHGRDTTN